jgi:hypothetical protein
MELTAMSNKIDVKANTGVTQHTNGGDGTSPAVVGHPPDFANVEPEASACHLKIRADAVGIHASALRFVDAVV